MSVTALKFSEPYYETKYLEGESEYQVHEKSIIFNFSEKPVLINSRPLTFFQSTVAVNTVIGDLNRCLIIEDFDHIQNVKNLFGQLQQNWTLAWDLSHDERHRGVRLWRSPKETLDDIKIGFHYAGSVPLNVGLHNTHGNGQNVKEVHTQIIGFGKMQECYENDLNTLYREEYMGPGHTHSIMFNENGEYPWHQYEALTEGIFMSVSQYAK